MVTRVSIARTVSCEQGGALVAVLAIVLVLTVLLGVAAAMHVARYRFVRRDVHRVQARYLAEAGVYTAMDSLQRDPRWRVLDAPLSLPGCDRCEVTVAGYGAFLLVRSVAVRAGSRYTARAIIGETPPPAFRSAIYLWDSQSSLNVAGTTYIRGDIVVGERGLVESTFKGRRFEGRVEGSVTESAETRPAFLDLHQFEEATSTFERWLRAPDVSATPEPRSYLPAHHLPSDNRIWHVSGDLMLDATDQSHFTMPITVAATGRLVVEGPLHLSPGTVLAAGEELVIHGEVTGREGLYYGRRGVDIGPGVRLAGQVFSPAAIRVHGDAYMHEPSVLFVSGAAASQGGGIVLEDSVVVDGTVVHAPVEPLPVDHRGRVTVQAGARVRGAIYNALETELHGVLAGSLVGYQLFFYETPTNYVNWLRDATVDAEARPVTFALPVGFSDAPRFVVIAWEGHIEDVDAAA